MIRHDLSRRHFLLQSAGTLLASTAWAQAAPPKRICVAALWHTVNIGDIAHGPGLVQLIEQYLPGTEVCLWPARAPTAEIRAMLARTLPKLTLIEGSVTPDGKPSSAEFAEAIGRCDLMILASGGYHPSPVAAWRKLTRNRYGVFGNGFEQIPALAPEVAEQLNGAQFVYGRESPSATQLRALGVKAPGLTFCPDSTFGFTLRDESRAEAYLARAGLEPGKFICVVPMLRYTPHWKLYGQPPKPSDLRGEETNAKYKAQDHAAVRELITRWVRETELKVLACPEMTYQMDLAQEQLIDPLPEDVKDKVVRRETFWMPDEAASVYARAVAVVSLECHSPILALANGTPAIHIRLPSENKKGQMFADIGVGEWLHEVGQLTGDQLTRQVLQIHADPTAARAKVRGATDRVNAIYRDVFAQVAKAM